MAKVQKQAKAKATDASAPNDTEAEYRTAVQRGIAACAAISDKQWVLGDLAATVAKQYGENRLEQFAVDIHFDGEVSTLSRYRSVSLAFPKSGGRPLYFASAQILQSHPDRPQIVTDNPNIGVRAARELMRQYRADHPENLPDETDLEEGDTEPSATTTTTTSTSGPTTSPAKARAKGSKKTAEQDQESEWAKDNRAWEREVEVIANNAKRVAAFLKRRTPEQRQRLVLDVDPSLGATVRSVSEEWRELADDLDEPLEKEADTLIQESRVKTTPATRPARPVRTSA